MDLVQRILSGSFDRRDFLKLAGCAGATGLTLGLPSIVSAEEYKSPLRVIPGYIGIPGETWIIPMVETVEDQMKKPVNKVLTPDKVPDLSMENYQHAIQQSMDQGVSFMLMVYADTDDQMPVSELAQLHRQTNPLYNALAMNLANGKNIGKVNIIDNGEFNQKKAVQFANFYNRHLDFPFVAFHVPGEKPIVTRGAMSGIAQNYEYLDDHLLDVGKITLLGDVYGKFGMENVPILDLYAMSTPHSEKQGFPNNTRFVHFDKRGTYEIHIKDIPDTLPTKFEEGEFQKYWLKSDYRSALVAEFGIDPKTVVGKQALAKVDEIFTEISRGKVYLYNRGIAIVKDIDAETRHMFPIPTTAAKRIYEM